MSGASAPSGPDRTVTGCRDLCPGCLYQILQWASWAVGPVAFGAQASPYQVTDQPEIPLPHIQAVPALARLSATVSSALWTAPTPGEEDHMVHLDRWAEQAFSAEEPEDPALDPGPSECSVAQERPETAPAIVAYHGLRRTDPRGGSFIWCSRAR